MRLNWLEIVSGFEISIGVLFSMMRKIKSHTRLGDNGLVHAFRTSYHFCLFELVFPSTISHTKHANTGTYTLS